MVAPDNPAYTSVSGCLVTNDGQTLMRGTPAGFIPAGVTRIGQDAFSGFSSITDIVIPNGVKSIGKDAFTSCAALTQVEFPDSVRMIGKNAFLGCELLKSVTLPRGSRYESNSFPEDCQIDLR